MAKRNDDEVSKPQNDSDPHTKDHYKYRRVLKTNQDIKEVKNIERQNTP